MLWLLLLLWLLLRLLSLLLLVVIVVVVVNIGSQTVGDEKKIEVSMDERKNKTRGRKEGKRAREKAVDSFLTAC